MPKLMPKFPVYKRLNRYMCGPLQIIYSCTAFYLGKGNFFFFNVVVVYMPGFKCIFLYVKT